MKKTFPNKFKDHFSIIRASALTIEPGVLPYRFVLRDLGQETDPALLVDRYVVHRENLILSGETWEHHEFYHGHYFEDLAKAEQHFHEKNSENVHYYVL